MIGIVCVLLLDEDAKFLAITGYCPSDGRMGAPGPLVFEFSIGEQEDEGEGELSLLF
jgi:hypothetical protein